MEEPATDELFRQRLETLGFVVVRHSDHLCVRLSLMTSVRVRVTDGKLSCEPRFGPFARTGATLVKTMGLSLVAFASLLPGIELPFEATLPFVALALWGYDGVRYSITEACITQVRQVFGTLLDARVDAPPAQIGEGYASPLDAPPRRAPEYQPADRTDS